MTGGSVFTLARSLAATLESGFFGRMNYQFRAGKYSFLYYDRATKRRIRLRYDEHPRITTKEEAEAYCKEWDEKHSGQKAQIKERLSWQDQYPEFEKLISQYEIDRKEDAQYSWHTSVYYLSYYAFPFFLSLKEETNVNKWFKHFEEFRDYLRTKPSIKQMSTTRKTLSYSTMNGVIKALNSFLIVLHRRAKLKSLQKCRLFPKRLLKDKSIDAVIPEDHQRVIYEQMRKASQTCADMFKVALGTGLRINELIGLSLADLFPGETKSELLNNAIRPYGWKVYGYLSLESQPLLNPPRAENGSVPRKPLKQKNTMSSKDGRIIPILSKDVFNVLVRYWNEQLEEFGRKTYGANLGDYLLFKGIHKQLYYCELIRAQNKVRLVQKRPYTPHDTRHTFCTDLAIKTGGNFTLCKIALGHTSTEITMHYCHIGEQMKKELQMTNQMREPLRELA